MKWVFDTHKRLIINLNQREREREREREGENMYMFWSSNDDGDGFGCFRKDGTGVNSIQSLTVRDRE